MIIKKCDKCSCYLRLLCTSKRNEVSIGFDEIVDVIGIPILKNYYSVDLLTVDSTIAIQALLWGSTAAATKAIGETGTLEIWQI